MRKHIIYILFTFMIVQTCTIKPVIAQDPNFSQFFHSPLAISPALAGNGDNKWRAMSTFRNQSLGFGTNYNTRSLSVDGKVFQREESPSYIGLGALFMQDDALDGAYKSTFVTLNAAVHVALDRNEIHGLTGGLGYVYNKTNINFNELTTGQQLSSSGFNRTLPTGEPGLTNIPGYSSVCAGLTYTFTTEDMVADFGVAGYRFFKTRQSVYDNGSQMNNPRYDAHFSMGKLLNDRLDINMSALYQLQSGVSGFIGGGYFGFTHSDDPESPKIFNLGAYYRVGDAIIPYVGYVFKDFQFAVTYDVRMNNNKSGSVTSNVFELSLIYRNYKSSRNPLLW
jgi:type IX secretion system PorP/SprF family membrane protein